MDKPSPSSADTAINLLATAVAALRNHPQDAHAGLVAGRIVNFLASFPTHFVVEYLAKDAAGKVTQVRVAPSDWPAWAEGLKP